MPPGFWRWRAIRRKCRMLAGGMNEARSRQPLGISDIGLAARDILDAVQSSGTGLRNTDQAAALLEVVNTDAGTTWGWQEVLGAGAVVAERQFQVFRGNAGGDGARFFQIAHLD